VSEPYTLSDGERAALKEALAVKVITEDPDDSYTRVGYLEDVQPTVEAIVSAALAEQRGRVEGVALRTIEKLRNEHWQEHLRLHPLADARSCPGCYGKHDAYYAASAHVRAALRGDG
jgi:hypothetical protein